MFKLESKGNACGKMNLFTHELGLLQLRLNILGQKQDLTNINGGVL
jgi:hypothetical protein